MEIESGFGGRIVVLCVKTKTKTKKADGKHLEKQVEIRVKGSGKI